MANTDSAKKRARQTISRNKILSAARSRVRTFIKKTTKSIDNGDVALSVENFKTLQPVLDKACSKGLVHKNFVARKKSKINSKIKNLIENSKEKEN